MKLFTKTLAAVLLSGCASLGAGKAPTAAVSLNPGRTLYISGVIAQNGIRLSQDIMKLAIQDTTQDINLIINSPGGIIMAGNMIIQAMNIAQARGIKFNCVSGIMAASMAFSIFHHCDNRYAFPQSLLLFHPARAMGIDTITGRQAQDIADQLLPMDADLLEDLKSMGMDQALMEKAYYDERMWTGVELYKATRHGYIIIINDVKGIPNPLNLGGQ